MAPGFCSKIYCQDATPFSIHIISDSKLFLLKMCITSSFTIPRTWTHVHEHIYRNFARCWRADRASHTNTSARTFHEKASQTVTLQPVQGKGSSRTEKERIRKYINGTANDSTEYFTGVYRLRQPLYRSRRNA